MFDLDAIPPKHRINRISAKSAPLFFEGFYTEPQPVIITGLARTWPAFTTWTVEHLKKLFGDTSHTFHYEEGRTIEMQVGDYLDALVTKSTAAFPELPSRSERLPYMRHFGPLGGEAFDRDYPITSLFPEADKFNFSSFLFCGVPATKTNCHYDWTNNFVGMIHGLKHVTLLPPHAEVHMDVPDELRKKMSVGNCDFFEDPPDLQLLPGHAGRPMHEHPVFLRSPHVIYSPLRDGDVVFFPANWYHYFHNIEGSISVTTQSCALDSML